MKTNSFPLITQIQVKDLESIELIFKYVERDERIKDQENLYFYFSPDSNSISVTNIKYNTDGYYLLGKRKKVNFYNKDSWPHHAKLFQNLILKIQEKTNAKR